LVCGKSPECPSTALNAKSFTPYDIDPLVGANLSTYVTQQRKIKM